MSVEPTDLRLDVDVRIEADFDFLSPEYRAFFRPARATAFQAPLWLDMIHRRLAPNLNATQHTITIRDRTTRQLLAVLPLVLQRAMGLKILQPADFGVCDYNAIVGDAAALEQIAADADVLSRIDALTRKSDILLFRKVRPDSFDVGRIFRRAKATPGENAAYHCDTGDDFEEWQRRTVRRKFSKELGRLQRQTEREHGSYEHRGLTSQQEIAEAFAFLRDTRAGRFEDDLLARDVYFEFYRDYAIAAAQSGEALTYVSYIAGKPVAFLFGLTGDGDFHAVLIGWDVEGFGKISPGTQIIYRLIKQRFDAGQHLFDMGLGNSGYKSHFRVDETQLTNVSRSQTVAGFAMAAVYHRAKPLKNFARKLVANVR